MAERERTAEVRCGYCFQEINSMVDPRELPCAHVFCLICLKSDHRDSSELNCPSCQAIHRIFNFEDLPKVKGGAKVGTEATSLTCDCENCDGQTAVCFCIECRDKICAVHLETHNSHFGTKHDTIPISVYETSAGKYKKVLCNMHGEEITLACQRGDRLSCNLCNSAASDDRCLADASTDSKGAGRIPHKLRPLREFEGEITAHFETLLAQSTKKMAELRKLDKTAWCSLDTEQVLCVQKIEMLDLVCEEQVRKMREQCEDMKARIHDYLSTLTNQVEAYNTELMDKKEKIEETTTKVRRWLRESHVTEMVQQKQQMTDELLEEINTDHVEFNLSAPALVHREEHERLCLDLVSLPTSLTLLTQFATNSKCYSVNHTSNGHLLLSLQTGVQVTKRHGRELKYNTPQAVTTAIAKDHVRYMLYSAQGVCGIDLCLSDLKQRSNLFAFSFVSSLPPCMAVSDKHIVVSTGSTTDLMLFNFAGNRHRRISIDAVACMLYFLPNGDLLASCAPSPSVPTNCVTKYHIEGHHIFPVWKCEGLDTPGGVCANSDGLIYVCSRSNQCVYILSPQGTKLRELRHDQLPTNTGQISVWREELAVPAVNDNRVYRFTINY